MIRTSGLLAAIRRWPIVLTVFGGQLLIALPAGAFVGAWAGQHFGSSLSSVAFSRRLDALLWGEWLSATPGLLMLGPMLLALLVLGALFHVFCDALIYDAVGRRDPRPIAESLASGARYFIRMLRLSLLALPLYAIAVGLAAGGLWGVHWLTEAWTSELLVMLLRLTVVAAGLVAVAACAACHALAKAEAVARDEKRVRLALWRGLVQLVRRAKAPWNVTFAYGLVGAGSAIVLSLVDVRIPRTSESAVAGGIALQQGSRLLWVFLAVGYAHAMTRLRRADT